MINVPTLAAAAGSGQRSVVKFLIDLDETDLEARGSDGASPLCAAATWGYDEIVSLLLEASCDPNVRNSDSMQSTPLHVAACQEHGKIANLLMSAGANAMLEDGLGRTAVDYASVADGIWPLFAVRGLTRTAKVELLQKGVLRKIPVSDGADAGCAGGTDALPFYSRPGSAYARADGPSGSGGTSSGSSGGHTRGCGITGAGCVQGGNSVQSRGLASVSEVGADGTGEVGCLQGTLEAIDPLGAASDDDDGEPLQDVPTFSLWRDR